MQIQTEPVLGPLGALLDPDGPTVRIAQLSKAEQATLAKAATILDTLRDAWGGDDNHPLDTDIALAAYVMRDLIEEQGRVDLG